MDFLNSPKVYKPKALISTFSNAICSIKSLFSSSVKFLSDNFEIASFTNSTTNSFGSALYEYKGELIRNKKGIIKRKKIFSF